MIEQKNNSETFQGLINVIKKLLDIISILWIILVGFTGLFVFLDGQDAGLFMQLMSIPAIIYLIKRRKYYKVKKLEKAKKKLEQAEEKVRFNEQKQMMKEKSPMNGDNSMNRKSIYKRKKIVIVTLFLIIVSSGYFVNYNSHQSIAKRAVVKQLKDPKSAEFNDVKKIGNIVEGTVRAKNSFGGYVVSKFMVGFGSDKAILFVDVK